MNLRMTVFSIFMLFFTCFSFAQNAKLEQAWLLDKIELSGFQGDENSFSKEESFFAYFLNHSNVFDLRNESLLMLVGGDQHIYQLRFEGNEIIFEYNNTVYVRKNDQIESFQSQGSTRFKFELQEDSLILQRKNENFVERYTFVLIH